MESVLGRLLAVDADVERPEYFLTEEVYIIGRQTSTSQIVVNRRTVSRIHAKIERIGSYYQLTNLSRQATYVNGQPITEAHILYDKDEIGLDTPQRVFVYTDENQTLTPSQVNLTADTIMALRFDERTMRFYLYGRPFDLAPRELRLLRYLYSRRGEVCSREECEEAVWGQNPIIEPNALHRVVADLRTAFRAVDQTTAYIETVRGTGYILNI